jgi:aspartate/methionine/tyrosine aminotransferase
MMLSERIQNINESPTAEIAAIASQMKRERIDIVDLSIGEPDFPTPQNVKKAAFFAINHNYTQYTLIPGTIELRQAITKKLKSENNLDYDIENIIVSNGAKHAIFNIILTLINKGDEVIIPAPYWVSYPEMVSIAGGKSVIVSTSDETNFKLSPEQLSKAISPKTKLLIICNPSNPSGTVYSRSELQLIAQVVEGKNIYVISDEIYEKLIYDNLPYTSIAEINPTIKKQTIVVNGLSKAYAMMGWRIGYAAGEREIIRGATKLQSNSTTNACSVSQFAAVEALTGPQEEIKRMHHFFEDRRDFVYSSLCAMDGISCCKPHGAFYAFPNISKFYRSKSPQGIIKNSRDMALYLLNEARIVLVPGIAFGSDNHIRISYATSMDRLEEGMYRLETALKKLH